MPGEDGFPGEEAATSWAAPWGAVALGVLGTLGLGAWALGAGDPPGRLLVGVAALAVAAMTAVGALARPRLRVDDEGLVLRGVTGTRRWAWERVDAVRVVHMRRMGVPAAYVEVEARDDGADGGRLLVLGRLELGSDPVEVAGALQDHRARAGRAARSERERADRHDDDEQDGDPADGEEPGGRA